MSVLKRAVTWWNSQTLGTQLFTARRGVKVGADGQGNLYYQTADGKKRWVIYNGEMEASRVAPDWHGWLHHTFDEPPTIAPLLRRSWEKDTQPNLTGTVHAWRPKGSIARGGERQKAAGDYEAWRPE